MERNGLVSHLSVSAQVQPASVLRMVCCFSTSSTNHSEGTLIYSGSLGNAVRGITLITINNFSWSSSSHHQRCYHHWITRPKHELYFLSVAGVKMFSYTSSGASLCMMPYILLKTGISVQSCPEGGLLWCHWFLHIPDSHPPPYHHQRLCGSPVPQPWHWHVHSCHLQHPSDGEKDCVPSEWGQDTGCQQNVHHVLCRQEVNACESNAVPTSSWL